MPMDTLPPTLQTALTELLLFLPDLITAIVVFIVTLVAAGYFSRIVSKALKARKADPQIILLLSRTTRWIVIITGTITALELVHFDVTAFVAGLGVAGIAAGFALQDMLSNFVAGIMLLIQRPFATGDRIETAGFFGTVEEVDLRATRLITPDGKDVLIPNKDVLGNPLTNWTRTPLIRIELGVGVAYDTDLDLAEQVSLQAIQGLPGLTNDPDEPIVWYTTFGDSSINFRLIFWVDTRETHFNEAKDEALKRVKKAFDQQGIMIPFPIRTVYMHSEG